MKVRIPPTLRAATGGEREVPGSGDTVGELLDDLMARFPALDIVGAALHRGASDASRGDGRAGDIDGRAEHTAS